MTAMVVDASMTLAWLFRDERTAATQAVFEMTDDHQVVVSAHWYPEIANALLVGERRKRCTPAESAMLVEMIDGLDIAMDDLDPRQALATVMPLARAHGLTAYDTLYLELAERRGLPLASLDRELCAAARAVGVHIVNDNFQGTQ